MLTPPCIDVHIHTLTPEIQSIHCEVLPSSSAGVANASLTEEPVYATLTPVVSEKRTMNEDDEGDEDEESEEPPAKMTYSERNAIKLSQIRTAVVANLTECADKMAQQHIHKLGEARIGDTVQVEVPSVDRGPGDLLHVLAYIISSNKQNMTYKLATSFGKISGMFTRNQFHICKQQILKSETLNLDESFSLRAISGKNSISRKQGFQHCLCSGKCDRRCSCKNAGVKCGTKCHKNKIVGLCENR
jgi:hypothetical protein